MSKRVMRKDLDESTPHSDPDYEVTPGARWEGSKSNKGSPDVYVNSKPIMRIDDTYKAHVGTKHIQMYDADGNPFPVEVDDQHSPPRANEGSSTVFANGIGVHLVGHDVECPQEDRNNSSKALGGSPDVFAGE